MLVQVLEKQRSWEYLGVDGAVGGCVPPSCPFSLESEMGLCSIKSLRRNRDLRVNLNLAWLFILRKASPKLWPPWLCCSVVTE